MLEEAQSSRGAKDVAGRMTVALGGTMNGMSGRGFPLPSQEERENLHSLSWEDEVEEEEAEEAFQWQHMTDSPDHAPTGREFGLWASVRSRVVTDDESTSSESSWRSFSSTEGELAPSSAPPVFPRPPSDRGRGGSGGCPEWAVKCQPRESK